MKLLVKNEHPVERVLRVVLGLALLGIALGGPKIVWGYIGVIPLLTGIVGSCPVYTLLGLSTCPVSPRLAPPQKP